MKKSHVGKRMLFLLAGMAVILTVIFITGMNKLKSNHTSDAQTNRQNEIVALNEINKLTEVDGESPARQQIRDLTEQIRQEETADITNILALLIILYVGSMVAILIVSLYIYIVVLRPFQKMETYAGELAKGNLDVELKYERHQLFGAFTWAFDHMRREIKKARNCEKEAIENNKTVIATLSHDIKTPIASIRAYAEGLEANMDSDAERRERYIRVLLRKCDEVTELTNDLFIHSISDMNMMKIELQKMQIRELLTRTIEELSGDRGDIAIVGSIEEAEVKIDPKRMCQVIENIINNARKYAVSNHITSFFTNQAYICGPGETTGEKTDQTAGQMYEQSPGQIQFRAERLESKNQYQIQIRDFGPGIEEKDLPFIFDKFYRGENSSEQPGAGLGLYIVKYVIEQMDGSVKLVNHSADSHSNGHGLTVVLSLPLI